MMSSYLSPADWDDRLRRQLLSQTIPFELWGQTTTTVVEVRLKGAYPVTVIQVIFTDSRRPECTFGFYWATGDWLREMPEYAADDPEWVVSMFWANFTEMCAGTRNLERACPSDEIFWLNASQE